MNTNRPTDNPPAESQSVSTDNTADGATDSSKTPNPSETSAPEGNPPSDKEPPKSTGKTKRARYHHGDLKHALLKAAEELLVENGSDGLTMRDLSKRIGVSRTAAYHHFRDRADLLAALATQGLTELMALAQEVMDDETLKPHEKFEQVMLTYVRYAANHPEKYNLMVGNDLWKTHPIPELQQLARTSFRRYVGWITYFSEQGVFHSNDPLRTSQLTWATLHGVCRLLMDGIFARRSDMEEILKFGLQIYTRNPSSI